MRLGIEELYYISAWRLNKSICLKHLDHTHTHTHLLFLPHNTPSWQKRSLLTQKKAHHRSQRVFFNSMCCNKMDWFNRNKDKFMIVSHDWKLLHTSVAHMKQRIPLKMKLCKEPIVSIRHLRFNLTQCKFFIWAQFSVFSYWFYNWC